MNDNFNMMDGMGGIMSWSMGLIGLLVIVVLVLSAAALIKYLIGGQKMTCISNRHTSRYMASDSPNKNGLSLMATKRNTRHRRWLQGFRADQEFLQAGGQRNSDSKTPAGPHQLSAHACRTWQSGRQGEMRWSFFRPLPSGLSGRS